MKHFLNALKTLAFARVPLNYTQKGLLSLLPLLLLLFGCGGNSVPGQGVPGGTPLPSDLKGQWQTAVSATAPCYKHIAVNYESPICNLPETVDVKSSTLGIAFYFFEDGRYEHVWIWETAYSYSCYRILTWSEQGTLNVAGTSFTFQPGKAIFRAMDNCAGLAVEEPAQAKTVTLKVTREQDATGWPLLRLGYPSGSDLVVEKCKTCD